MHKKVKVLFLATTVAVLAGCGSFANKSATPVKWDPVKPEVAAQTQPHVKVVKAYVMKHISGWLADPLLIDSIKKQNAAYAGLTQAEIDKMDAGWIARTDKPLIDEKMGNPLAQFLVRKKDEANRSGNNAVHEIFVMDNRGLNVGQTNITKDFWQGDEAKWQQTYLKGPDAVFVDAIDKKGVAQFNMSIKDPQSGKAIGVVTVGVFMDKLQ